MLSTMQRFLAVLASVASISFGHSTPRRQIVPINLAVVGQGAIRVRLSAGQTAPCDSSDDKPIFDGSLTPGRYVFQTAVPNVCLQHTYGQLRDTRWSSPLILPTVLETRSGNRLLIVTLSTDAPLG